MCEGGGWSDYLVPCLLFLHSDARLILCMRCCVLALVVFLFSLCYFVCCVPSSSLCSLVCFVPARSLSFFLYCVPDLSFCSFLCGVPPTSLCSFLYVLCSCSQSVPFCVVLLLSLHPTTRFLSPLIVFCMFLLFS
jgi:hypothetical protein